MNKMRALLRMRPALLLVAGMAGINAQAADQTCYRSQDSEGLFADAATVAAAPTLPQVLEEQARSGKAMQRCYARALRRNPDLHGQLRLGVRINAEGRVDRVLLLESDHNDPLLHGCLGEMVCGWAVAPRAQASLHVQAFGLDPDREAHRWPTDMVGSRKLSEP